MPINRYYTVRQTREVKVRASNPISAVRIADCAFENGQTDTLGAKGAPSDVYGNTTTMVRVRDIDVTEDY